MPTNKRKVSAHIDEETLELLERSLELQQVSMSAYLGGLIARDLQPKEPVEKPAELQTQPVKAKRPDPVQETKQAIAALEPAQPLRDFSKTYQARRGNTVTAPRATYPTSVKAIRQDAPRSNRYFGGPSPRALAQPGPFPPSDTPNPI